MLLLLKDRKDAAIVQVCAMLHNTAMQSGMPVELDTERGEGDKEEVEDHNPPEQNNYGDGRQYQGEIIWNFFS